MLFIAFRGKQNLAKNYSEKKIVFLAIGFETTIAIICATVKAVHAAGLKNVFFFSIS